MAYTSCNQIWTIVWWILQSKFHLKALGPSLHNVLISWSLGASWSSQRLKIWFLQIVHAISLQLHGQISPTQLCWAFNNIVFACSQDPSWAARIWGTDLTYLISAKPFNSLAPGRFEWNFRLITNFQADWWLRYYLWYCPQMNVTGPNWG